MKKCASCQEECPLESFTFSPNSHASDKRGILCRHCRSILSPRDKVRLETAHWRKNNPSRSKTNSLKSHLKIKYGQTLEEYDTFMVQLEGKCAICGEPEGKRRLHIDHCHKTGKIRGLLCHGCNIALGGLKDDIGLLEKAIVYIRGSREDDN